ncbi:hypothetical protein QTP86_010884 [Hemibagrus guttatus]|nr:hypothetical protein QTP86_010884 [Hemibagrus guttatus]
MDKRKDLSEFDQKGQIVMARPLDQNISKTAALVGCSRSAVVSIYQKWSKEGTVVNRRQGHGRSRHIDARMERRLARVVRSNRRATVAQIAEEVNAGSDRKGSEYTVQDGSGLFWQQKGSCYVMLHRYCWSAKWGLDQNIQRNAESCPITSHNQEKECELIVRYQTQQLNSSSDAELKLDGFQEEASPSERERERERGEEDEEDKKNEREMRRVTRGEKDEVREMTRERGRSGRRGKV